MSIVSKLRYLNVEMVAALLRTVAQVGGGIVAERGWATSDDATAIAGALVTIAVTFWGMWARSDKNLIESATSVPAVHNITMDKASELASATLTLNEKVNG